MHGSLQTVVGLILALALAGEAASSEPSKIHPERARQFVLANQEVTLPFIVEAKPDAFAALGARLGGSVRFLREGGIDRNASTLLQAYAIVADGSQALAVSAWEEVDRLWFVYEDMAPTYFRTILALEHLTQTGERPAVANLSLAPPAHRIRQLAFDPDEPFNRATRIAAESGVILVLAAGNGGPQPNSLSPWCRADWVICVGAATRDGQRLWERSARGDPARPGDGPTIVAPGVDILTTHPAHIPKTRAMLEAEQRIGFDALVPADKRSSYAVVSGTSMAAPHVSRIVAILLEYMAGMRQKVATQDQPNPSMATLYSHGGQRPWDVVKTEPRYAGTIEEIGSVRVATYPMEPTWQVIKQILIDMAIQVPGHGEDSAGAGFVAEEIALEYYGAFGSPDIDLRSYKVR